MSAADAGKQGEPSDKELSVPECMRFARKQAGKSYLSQIREMYGLSRGLGKISAHDYYYYNLYDDRKHKAEEKRRFLSDRIHPRIINACCDVHWWGMADDKLMAYALLNDLGVAVPKTIAAYHPGTRYCGKVPTLRNEGALARFLKDGAAYPFFAKKIGGVASYGAYLVDSLEADRQMLMLGDGRRLSADAFARNIAANGDDGYLFQEVLQPHPTVRAVCGERVSTIRVIVIVHPTGPEIIHTVWKIPAVGNIADNFWRVGNMLAAVDLDSGVVSRCVRGVGPQQTEIESHPDTGHAIKGFGLPHWENLQRLCLEGANLFHKLRYQSWDIALCASGPVAVEVNTGSSFLLSQVATDKGFLDDRFAAFLRNNGVKL
jgi:hypothetical protein